MFDVSISEVHHIGPAVDQRSNVVGRLPDGKAPTFTVEDVMKSNLKQAHRLWIAPIGAIAAIAMVGFIAWINAGPASPACDRHDRVSNGLQYAAQDEREDGQAGEGSADF